MTGDAGREGAAATVRWDRWQERYDRSSRRRARHARVATALIFAAILANLFVQLFFSHV